MPMVYPEALHLVVVPCVLFFFLRQHLHSLSTTLSVRYQEPQCRQLRTRGHYLCSQSNVHATQIFCANQQSKHVMMMIKASFLRFQILRHALTSRRLLRSTNTQGTHPHRLNCELPSLAIYRHLSPCHHLAPCHHPSSCHIFVPHP